jgi:hypothetical protein
MSFIDCDKQPSGALFHCTAKNRQIQLSTTPPSWRVSYKDGAAHMQSTRSSVWRHNVNCSRSSFQEGYLKSYRCAAFWLWGRGCTYIQESRPLLGRTWTAMCSTILILTMFNYIMRGLLSPPHGASSGCGWRRRPPDMEGSCEYTS